MPGRSYRVRPQEQTAGTSSATRLSAVAISPAHIAFWLFADARNQHPRAHFEAAPMPF